MMYSSTPLLPTPFGPESVRFTVPLLSGLVLRRMYGAGPRKVSVIMGVHIRQVFIKQGFTVTKAKTGLRERGSKFSNLYP